MSHKSRLELVLRKNVFTPEISDVVESYLIKMRVDLAKRDGLAKKRRAEGDSLEA